MKLNSVEIQGFKSFPDKIKLEFNCPITAVVGPNGSGKSNIGDAIRWVLGEQSVRTLRGDKMEDVIFGGTGERNPMGFAAVTISIDNSDKSVRDMGDEISISRRIYRDGESDYKINGKSSRLRDIQEILMDTGLGKDGYFIIGQGKIAEIISAKGRERREIFEEAAGISKYRFHKSEAEKKLLHAEENLERLNDILSEIEERIDPLKKESEKAAQFLKFAEEKKILEVSLWLKNLHSINEVMKSENDKILISRKEYNEINDIVEKTEEKIQGIFKKMQECSVKSEDHRIKIKGFQDEKSVLISQKAVFENDIKHNLKSEKELEEEIKGIKESISDLEEKDKNKKIRLSENREKIVRVKAEKLETERTLENIKSLSEKFSEEISFKKARRAALYSEINREKLTLASNESILNQNKIRIHQLETQMKVSEEGEEAFRRRYKEIAESLPIFENRLKELQEEKENYEKRQKELFEESKELDRRAFDLESIMKLNMQRAGMLSDMEKNMEGFSNSVKAVHSAFEKGKLDGIEGTVSQVIKTEEKYSLAVETALGAAMQNIIVQDETAAKKAIAYLAKEKAGRATFLPLTSVKGYRSDLKNAANEKGFIGEAADLVSFDEKFQNIINSLLGRTAVADNLENATALAKKHGYKFKVVTLDGQVINAGGSFTGGSHIRSAGILSRRSEIESLKKEIPILKEKINNIRENKRDIQREYDKIKQNIELSDSEIKLALKDRDLALSEKRKMEYEAESESKRKELFLLEKENLRKDAVKYAEENSGAQEALDKFNKELQNLEREISEKSEEKQSLLHKENVSEQELSSLKVTLALLEKDAETLTQNSEGLAYQIILEKRREEDTEKRKEELIKNNFELQKKVNDSLDRMKEIEELSDDYSESIRVLTQKRNEYEKEASELRNSSKEILYKREKLASELTRFSERAERYRSDYDSIVGKLWDEYELTLTESEKIKIPVEDVKKAETELLRVKGEIKNLGSVNLKAADEYEKVNSRYQFMKKQIDDVVKSKKALNKLIEDLTAKMKRIFKTQFELINKNFGLIFAELFDGGCGRLYLTDKNDVLESGIEIEARPPGKIIKNLSLLSGGEQAFTAVAIYFAILKVNPSPFCILDEIEAALDEVNVVKYAKYLRKLSDKTQFIAITHRRGTMEEADVLYGVTMQEEGVSKLLKLDSGELPENYENEN